MADSSKNIAKAGLVGQGKEASPPAICVFCGASKGGKALYTEIAKEVGKQLAQQGISLVYGGGSVGLMGAVAHAVNDNGGNVHGVIPKAMVKREVASDMIQEQNVIIVRTMHERKRRMAEQSDAFLALPGGFGTLDELAEMITWTQLGVHKKPIGLLNVDGFFDHLIAFIDHAVKEGFISERAKSCIIVEKSPAELINRLLNHEVEDGLLVWD